MPAHTHAHTLKDTHTIHKHAHTHKHTHCTHTRAHTHTRTRTHTHTHTHTQTHTHTHTHTKLHKCTHMHTLTHHLFFHQCLLVRTRPTAVLGGASTVASRRCVPLDHACTIASLHPDLVTGPPGCLAVEIKPKVCLGSCAAVRPAVPGSSA